MQKNGYDMNNFVRLA